MITELITGRLGRSCHCIVVVADADDLYHLVSDVLETLRAAVGWNPTVIARGRHGDPGDPARTTRRPGRSRSRDHGTRRLRMGCTMGWGISFSSMTVMSGSTMSPPLNAAMGVESPSGPTNIDIPRGGRPLVTANNTPAAPRAWTASIAFGVRTFSLVTKVPSTSAKRSFIPPSVIRGLDFWVDSVSARSDTTDSAPCPSHRRTALPGPLSTHSPRPRSGGAVV